MYFFQFLLAFTLLSLMVYANKNDMGISPLKLLKNKTLVLDKAYEISGLAVFNQQWITLLDNEQDHYIYQLESNKQKHAKLSPLFDLTKLKGFSAYKKKIVTEKQKRGPKFKQWDLEGIAVCQQKIYLINERLRHLLEVDTQTQTLNDLTPSLHQSMQKNKQFKTYYQQLFSGGANAGFEGIAIDCKKQKIYIAKERSPRYIIIFDLKQQTVQSIFNLPDTPENRKNFSGNKKGKSVNEDFAGLTFYQDFLYALERNNFIVLKIDPQSKKIIKKYSFAGPNFDYIHFAQTDEPYGMAEAINIVDGIMAIGFDTNSNPLNHKLKKLTNTGIKKKDKNLILFFEFKE